MKSKETKMYQMNNTDRPHYSKVNKVNVTNQGGGDIEDGSITTEKLANGAVTGDKIQLFSITSANISAKGVKTGNLADKSVTSGKLADEAVTSDKIAGGAVTASKISPGAVNRYRIADGAVTNEKLADGAITKDDVPRELNSTVVKGSTDHTIFEVTDGDYRLCFYVGGGAHAADIGTESDHPVGIYTNGNRVWVKYHQGEYIEIKDTSTPPQSRHGGISLYSDGGSLKYYGTNGVEVLKDTSKLLSGVEQIADPAAATSEEIANKVNEILNALKG